MQILRLMQSKGVNPDQLTFGYLIPCLVRTKHFEEARTLYEEMRSQNVS
jgi:pentatricopeptide repeat protein